MATTRWLARQQKTAQVTTVQITAYDAATTYSLIVNAKDVSTPGVTDADGTAAALAAAWNASAEPEFAEVTATSATDTVTLTADTPGKPFSVSENVSGGTGTIGSPATATANQSPNDWNDAENWDEGSVPSTADDVILEQGDTDQSVKHGLLQSGDTKTSLTIFASFEGHVGLPVRNEDAGEYAEYRAEELTLEATTVRIGESTGNGSGLIRLNLGSVQTTVNVFKTGTSFEPNVEACLIRGTHASNALNVNDGSVGIAVQAGQVATFATINVRGGFLRCGAGTTLTTVNVFGGTVEINSSVPTLNVYGGVVRVARAAAITTLTIKDATVNYASSGTVTQLTLRPNGTFESVDDRAFTITNEVDMHAGSSLIAPNGNATLSNGFITVDCRLSEVVVELGVNRQYAVT